MRLPRFLSKLIPGFEVTDIKEWRKDSKIEIYFKKREKNDECDCSRCGEKLENSHGRYRLKLKHLPIFDQQCYLFVWREKRWCPGCKKVRSEALDFISKDTPHLTQEYAYWLGRMFEIASVKQVAALTKNDKSTLHRLDFNRLRRMVQNYKIPDVTHISIDEVHARSKKAHKSENRSKLFFTIVTCLKTRRVVWVSESRAKSALDEFFTALGKERCSRVRIVAIDQHDAYKKSIEDNCPWAVVIWDKFHLIQNFERILNDVRMHLHDRAPSSELKRLTRGRWRFAFLKKDSKRTSKERKHIQEVVEENKMFLYLELIKERFFQFFYAKDPKKGREIFDEIGDWIRQSELPFLEKWWNNLDRNWKTVQNYFLFPVTTALSEGTNNVIKMLKRRGFGYRNMAYFKLKIMQVCGFLNSRYVPMDF